MAAPISNTFSITPPKTQTTTPATTPKGTPGLLDYLGITPGMGFGGKPLFPAIPPTAPTAPAAATIAPKTGATSTGAAATTVDLSHVPASAVAALSSGGLTGQALVDAQKALADHYTSLGSTPSVTTQQQQPQNTQTPTVPNTGTSVTGATPATTPGAVSGVFSTVAGSLANPTAPDMTTTGASNYDKAVQNLADFRTNVAETTRGIYAPGATTSARIMQGRDAALQNANAAKEQALEQEVTQAQQEVGFGQAQQGLNQGAQEAALSATAPQQNYPFVFNPTTGTYTNQAGGMVTPEDAAKALDEGQLSPDKALAAISYLGPTAQSQLIAAMKGVNPGFNWNTAAGAASAQQQNAATLGTAGVQGQGAVLATIAPMQAANTAASGIKNTIITYLASNPNINASNLAASNQLQQWVNGKQLTDPKYQTLFNYLNEYTNTLTPTLGVGGDSTNLKTEIAQSFVNAAASGKSIAEVLDNMQTLAENKVQNLQSGSHGGGVVSGPGSSSATGGFAEAW